MEFEAKAHFIRSSVEPAGMVSAFPVASVSAVAGGLMCFVPSHASAQEAVGGLGGLLSANPVTVGVVTVAVLLFIMLAPELPEARGRPRRGQRAPSPRTGCGD